MEDSESSAARSRPKTPDKVFDYHESVESIKVSCDPRTEWAVLDERRHREYVTGERRGAGGMLVRAALHGLSYPYGAAVALRNMAYARGWARVERVAAPVISVGNLTTGGTGKTPVAAWLARWFRARSVRVCFLSRGYRAGDDALNDEALVLEHLCPDVPHLQNPDRVSAARTALEELDMQLLILDDGFQHRRLARDLDVVLIDALEPWGCGHLLPRGYLRESRRGLRRADLAVVTRVDTISAQRLEQILCDIQRIAPGLPVATVRFESHQLANWSGATQAAGSEHNGPIGAFCGIGNPRGFFATLAGMNLSPSARREYPDHHRYTRDDVNELIAWGQSAGLTALLTTRKDLVKLQTDRLGTVPLWCVDQEVRVVEGAAELERLLEGVLARVTPDPVDEADDVE
jgi:tetraacyldisaccharide 4'-kinase